MYLLRTERKKHYCQTLGEVYKKAWLARLLGEWIMIYESSEEEEWALLFNWPAHRFGKR